MWMKVAFARRPTSQKFDCNADPDPDPSFHFNADPDPDPASKINADPCGSGSARVKQYRTEQVQMCSYFTNACREVPLQVNVLDDDILLWCLYS